MDFMSSLIAFSEWPCPAWHVMTAAITACETHINHASSDTKVVPAHQHAGRHVRIERVLALYM